MKKITMFFVLVAALFIHQQLAEPCDVEGCAECWTHNNCKVCANNYDPVLEWNNHTKCVLHPYSCLVPNCRQCEPKADRTCINCEVGYYLTNFAQCEPYCTVPNCNKCLSGNGNSCAECDAGYTKVGGTCQPPCTASNCQTCQWGSGTACSVCKTGYILIGSTCQPACTVPNCTTCQSGNNTKCTTCANKFRLSNDGTTCESICNHANCETCQEGSTFRCETCDAGYYLKPDGSSYPKCYPYCNAANCQECWPYSGTKCLTCQDGYTWMEDGSCQPCLVANCTKCVRNNPNVCATCDYGFQTYGGACKYRCNLPDCASCAYANPNSPEPTSCTSCYPPFSLNTATGRCEGCRMPGCAKCHMNDPGFCLYCRDDLWLIDNECKYPCDIMGCYQCDYRPGERFTRGCKVCQDGWVPDSDGKSCRLNCTDENCRACDPSTPDFCFECYPPFLPDEFGACGGIVQVCNDGCESCDPNDPFTCLVCASPYTLTDGQCYLDGVIVELCAEGCESCDPNDSSICLVCDFLYTLVDGLCIAPCEFAGCQECFYQPGATYPLNCKVCENGFRKENGFCELRME